MSVAELQVQTDWSDVCPADEILPNLGVRALLGKQQIAIFRVQGELFAISAIDPFTGAAVLSRGIIGDLQGQIVVASPIFKQHFNLRTGICLEDESVKVDVFAVREFEGKIQLAV